MLVPISEPLLYHNQYSYPYSPGMHITGLSDGVQTAAQGASIAATGVGITAGVISSGLITSATLSAWIPIVGPIIAGVTLILSLLAARKKPSQKRQTTAIVNEVEPHLKENLDGYFAGPRTKSSQYLALQNFDAAWKWIVESCGSQDDKYGEPGSWCIEDRLGAGRTVSFGWRTWTGNGKYDWYAYYRDPIANDSQVKPDPLDLVAQIESHSQSLTLPVLAGVLTVLALSLMGGKS